VKEEDILNDLINRYPALDSCKNDILEASLVFAQQVVGYGENGDVLITISTSGNSQNIVDAAITAKAKGLTVIGLMGQNGGRMKQYCDITVCIPSDSTPEVQEYHLPIYHTICRIVENRFFQ